MRSSLSSLVSLALAVGLVAGASSPANAQVPGRAPPAPAPSADEPARPPPAVVVAPVVKKNEGAAYPQQALDEGVLDPVEVPLVLDIDASGAVTKAVVETPVGHGFDEAAVAAAQSLEFEPATRGGKPVASRIRFTYTFAPPPSVLSGQVLTLAGDHPVAGASVAVRGASGSERIVTTDAQGAGRVEGLAAGSYHSDIAAPGRAPHEADETLQARRRGHRRSIGSRSRSPGRQHPGGCRPTTSKRSRFAARSRPAR